eukprot:m.65472 g.65472  ORF g.65472 m.65472 type:complete len:375 (+) comp35319_c0_seq16:304-1428(+)
MDDSSSDAEFYDAEDGVGDPTSEPLSQRLNQSRREEKEDKEEPRKDEENDVGEEEKVEKSREVNDRKAEKSEIEEYDTGKTPEVELPMMTSENKPEAPVAPPRRRKKDVHEARTLPEIKLEASQEGQLFDSSEDLTVAAVKESPEKMVIHREKDVERPRLLSASGRPFTDTEILEQVSVKNLDTGETMSLSVAEERIPKGANPLSLHIMRLTSEYVSMQNLAETGGSDDDSKRATTATDGGRKLKERSKAAGRKIKKFLRRTKDKLKQVKEEMFGDEAEPSEDESQPDTIRVKPSSHHKGPFSFQDLQMKQDLSGEHMGAVWTMKFSTCGRLLVRQCPINFIEPSLTLHARLQQARTTLLGFLFSKKRFPILEI